MSVLSREEFMTAIACGEDDDVRAICAHDGAQRQRIAELDAQLAAARKERDEGRAEIDKMRTGPLTDLLAFAGIAPSRGTAHGGLLSEIHRLDAELASLRLRVQEGEALVGCFRIDPAYSLGGAGHVTVNGAGLIKAIRDALALSPTCELRIREVPAMASEEGK